MAHFVHHLLTAIPGPLLPMIRSEFQLDYTRSGLVISAFGLSYGIGQLPAGWFADRIGTRLLLTLGICGVAIAGFLVGISNSFSFIILFLALMGILGGGYHPAAPPVISSLVDPRNRGRALGFHMIGGSGSFFIAPILAAAMASYWGWRMAFIWLSLPTIAFGVFLFLILGRATADKGRDLKALRTWDEKKGPPGRLRRLVMVIALSTFTGALFISVISFIPLILVDHFHVSKETAGALLGIIYSAGLWAGPVAGYISDRLGRVPVMLAACFIGGPIIYLITVVPYGWGFMVLLVSIGIIIYVRMPVTESYIVGNTSPHNRSTILGIYYFCAMEGGGILTPIIGYSIDRIGFYTTYTLSGAFLFLVTLAFSLGLAGGRDD